ncbi:MAG: hypothetical protein WBV45_12330 [Lutimonas sp.]
MNVTPARKLYFIISKLESLLDSYAVLTIVIQVALFFSGWAVLSYRKNS